ncbi:MAG: tyrosine-protein phosphatase [Bacteroidaceae bacterium]|nr:tyrosine-protein phosphatase [Bacteroidaceae bacterium]
MRTYLRTLTLSLAWLLMNVATVAQTWTASAPASGTFYLYNVGNDGFLRGANDWSTRASLTRQGGIPVTLSAGTGDGVYYLSTSPTYNGLFLGYDGYVDVAKNGKYTAWRFIAVEGEENTFLLQATANNQYLVGNDSDPTKTTVTATEPATALGYWRLASREALLAAFGEATQESPVDATFLVLDPYFGRVTNAAGLWKGTAFTTHNGYASGASQNYCVEMWNTTFDSYQELTGLPNGVYRMTVQGFYRMGGGANDATAAAAARTAGTEALNAKYYLNAVEAPLMSIFDSELMKASNSEYNTSAAVSVSGVSYYVPNNLSRAARAMMLGEYVNAPLQAVVTDGTLRIGVRKSVASSQDWAAWDNITLTYCGIDLSALVESYETQLAAAKALQPQLMYAGIREALAQAIAAAETDVNTGSQAWLEAALSALTTAIGQAQASIDLYQTAIPEAIVVAQGQSTSETVKSALQTKYEEGTYADVAAVYAIYQSLEAAALGTAPGTDYTSLIINAGFELGNTVGWSFEHAGSDMGAFSTTNDTYLYSGTEGAYLFNTWTKGISTLDLYQTVSGLPAGYYTLSAVVASFGDGAPITMTANGSRASVYPTNAADVDGEKKVGYVLTVEEAFVGSGVLHFKVQNTGKGQTLLKADAFKLTFVRAYEPLDNYRGLELEVSLENDEVALYLANTTYTTDDVTVMGDYETDPLLRYDRPAVVAIPVPAQETEATLSVSTTDDFAASTQLTVAPGTVLYDLPNLLPQQAYYYKVVADEAVIADGTIHTGGRLRMIKADGIANFRDLGGWETADGNRLRYGKIYRGSELRAGKFYTASDRDLAMLKADLGIGAEVDLREDIDFLNGTMTASAIDGATYYYANLNRWGEDALNLDAAKFRSAFDLVLAALRADKAAYFHCIYGADRTGCFAFLLEGLLGLPVDQLYKDYELTSFSSAGLRTKDGIDHKIQYISALQGATLQEKFFNYWRGAVGVPAEDLLDFIRIMVDGESAITSAELADLPAAAVADGDYYLYLPVQQCFLGRGAEYGTRGVADSYGVPATVRTSGAGVATVCFLDNRLYLGSDGYADKAPYYNTTSWFIEPVAEGYVLRSHNGAYLKMYDDARVRVDAADVSEATPVTFLTLEQQKALLGESRQANLALADGYHDTDEVIAIKSATAGSTTDWVLTATTGSTYNTGTYGGELYQTAGTVSQTVSVPHAGLYRLTLNALYRQGSNADCSALGAQGYELSNAYVSLRSASDAEADAYTAQIPSWYSDAAAADNPNTTDQAKALMDAGKYAVELYAYIDESCQATITIHVPNYIAYGWCLFNNFRLTALSDTDDAIGSIREDTALGQEAAYDLAGRKLADRPSSVSNLPHGVYILNGRKILVGNRSFSR